MANFLPQLDLKPVCGAAFSIARYKIKWELFRDFLKRTVEVFEGQKSLHRHWKNYQVIAGDGTTVSAPVCKDTISRLKLYSQTAEGTKTVLANACMLYDVMSNIVIDAQIDASDVSETVLFRRMLLEMNWLTNIILVLDRGFSTFSLFQEISAKGGKFCIRLNTSNNNFANKVLAHPEDDFITTWYPSETERSTCKQKGMDCEPLQVRVTKIALPSGEIEVLISNLFDMEHITTDDLKELYHLRWGIEEAFKQVKPQMKLEQFGSKKTDGIFQEFFAHLTMMNITGIIAVAAQQKIEESPKKLKGKYKYKYKYNRLNAWKNIRERIVKLYHIDLFPNVLEELVTLIAGSKVAVRPNRVFPHNNQFRQKKHRASPMYK